MVVTERQDNNLEAQRYCLVFQKGRWKTATSKSHPPHPASKWRRKAQDKILLLFENPNTFLARLKLLPNEPNSEGGIPASFLMMLPKMEGGINYIQMHILASIPSCPLMAAERAGLKFITIVDPEC